MTNLKELKKEELREVGGGCFGSIIVGIVIAGLVIRTIRALKEL